MADRAGKAVQDRPHTLERCAIAANHKRQRAGFGTLDAAGHRRIEAGDAGRRLGGQRRSQIGARGGEVDQDLARARRSEQAASTAIDRGDVVRAADHGEHHVCGRSDLGRRPRPARAVGEQRLGLGAGAAVHHQTMPGR
jgi:hypothetical protein